MEGTDSTYANFKWLNKQGELNGSERRNEQIYSRPSMYIVGYRVFKKKM